ncbi:MAG: flagellar hook-associated protein FlgK [Oscillospiraceae bacterium]|nr:flagellar hook-associated protein FlgK [Oscillospiraceae bacterium]
MASSFMGLYVQREALVAAQKSLDIVGNNISNMNTTGYSRQRVDVCSVANTGYNLMYNTSVSLAGQGVDTVGVAQYRDALIDDKVRNYTTLYNEYSVKDTVMSDVETALDNIESDEYGFAATLAEFKAALQSYSSDEADRDEIANVVFSTAESVVQQIQYMNSRLDDISAQVLTDTQLSIDSVNSILASMAETNKQLSNSYVQMGYIEMSALNYQVDNDYGSLELKDTMNTLIDQLSAYGNVEVTEESNGSYTISFAGQIVVYNDQYAQMAMTEENPDPLNMEFIITDAGTYDANNNRYTGLMTSEGWQRDQEKYGMTVDELVRYDAGSVNITSTNKLESGSLRALLDVYNGDGSYAEMNGGDNTFQGIEYYRDMLNAFTETFVNAFNSIYADYEATDEDGNTTVLQLFDCGDDFRTMAANVSVTETWRDNPSLLAQPEQFVNGVEDEGDELNNDYIHKCLAVFENSSLSYQGSSLKMSLEKYVAHISDTLGTQISSNSSILETTDIMLDSVLDARDEVMGVSLDEEGVNMINYQKWYNAIARMVTTLDEALDKVINGMGLVGLS